MLSEVILKTSSPWMTKATKYLSGVGTGMWDDMSTSFELFLSMFCILEARSGMQAYIAREGAEGTEFDYPACSILIQRKRRNYFLRRMAVHSGAPQVPIASRIPKSTSASMLSRPWRLQ